MCRFTGRASEAITIPIKPIPKGFKVMPIASKGYFFCWVFWNKKKGKAVGVTIPRALGGNSRGNSGNSTQAYVPHLLLQLPP
jgi:hypothetical protein